MAGRTARNRAARVARKTSGYAIRMQSDVNVLPLRGNTIHEIMDNDHQAIKRLLDGLTKATQRDERMRIIDQLKGALTIHNAMEENLIYPALDKVAGHMMESQKLYHQTASADIELFEADTALKKGEEDEFVKCAEKLHDAVYKHIDAEDESAVPHLKEKSDTAESQMLLEAVRKFRMAMSFAPDGAPARVQTGEIGTANPAYTRRS